MFYSKCDKVVPEIKKIVKELLDKWMRPIMNRSDNYRDRIVKEVEYTPSATYRRISSRDNEDLVSTSIQNRARIPAAHAPRYDIAPKSHVAMTEKKTSERYRKLKNKMIMIKRKGK
jgi:transcription factor SPN1